MSAVKKHTVSKFSSWHQICSLATKQVGKPSVYVSNGLDFLDPKEEEIWKFIIAAVETLYGSGPHTTEMLSNLITGGLFFFDNENDQYNFYKIFEQELTDSSPIYACTYDLTGKPKTENT